MKKPTRPRSKRALTREPVEVPRVFSASIVDRDYDERLWDRPNFGAWFERDRLELYAVACISVGEYPAPQLEGTALARLGLLLDAVRSGKLAANIRGKASKDTAITEAALRAFANASAHPSLIKVCADWRAANPAASAALASADATSSRRRQQRSPVSERVTNEMKATERAELNAMSEKEMADRFKASRKVCRNVRNAIGQN